MDQVRTSIETRRLVEGEMLPSVCHIAEDLQVNPMTVIEAVHCFSEMQ